MIRRILAAIEEGGHRPLFSGLDPHGEIAWRQTGTRLLERTGAWQRVLFAQGVRPGDRVGIEVGRGPELLPAHLAILASGAAVVPINPALSAVERERVLGQADLRTRIADSDAPEGTGPVTLREAPARSAALLVFTSGTTGEAKGVPLTGQNLEANLEALTEAWGMRSADRLLHALPAHHVHGLVLALYGSARLGAEVLLDARFDADRALTAISRHEVTLFMGVPTMYHRMVASTVEADVRTMRLFVSGSAPLAPQDFHAFDARFGARPLERYGLTETMIVTTNPLEGERRPGTVGFPLPGVEVRLASDGEVEVRGSAVMSSYWRAPDLTRDAFRDGFFRTGDLGRIDERGYLVISGRTKDLILVGGSNVLPGEVERALCEETGVDELAVVGLPDSDLGEIVSAFVVAHPGTDPRDLEARLRARAEKDLAPYKRPRRYEFVDHLPRNAMGKIDRQVLAG
jgi:malonyl-CoA/methylmalonyl-CoA synthetase